MDAFEVRLTPQRVKNTRMVTQNREPVRLMMAPFSSKSVITFEDIPVTKTARRFLIIENPIEEVLQVQLSCKNTQKPIKNLQFEWLEGTVPALGESTVEIAWTPAEMVACKETFFVSDQRGFKKELHIIFKSSGGTMKGGLLAAARKPLRPRNCGSGLSTVGVTAKRQKTPSPPQKKRVTGKRLSPLVEPPYKAPVTLRGTTPKRATRPISHSQTPPLDQYHHHQQQRHPMDFNELDLMMDDKENSPVYPRSASRPTRGLRGAFEGSPNASDIFKNIQFTPAADKSRALDYMASLPTPKLGEVHDNIIQHQNVSALTAKKIVWSPVFEGIREEVSLVNKQTPQVKTTLTVVEQQEQHIVTTPEIIVTQTEEVHVIQSKTIVKEYHNLDLLPPNSADARRSLFEDEIEAPVQHNSSTETYIKDLSVHIQDANRTRVLTPPPLITHRASHVFQAPQVPLRDTIANRVESIVTTPLQKKSSESMRNLSSKKTREQEYLKLNQGSMPNLHEIESINSIESNRYYSQISASNTAMSSVAANPIQRPNMPLNPYDSSLILFRQNEIRAQSSCTNLHELPDNTGLIKTNSERLLRTQDKNAAFGLTPAASRVRSQFMTLSPPKCLTSTQKKNPVIDANAAKWSQAVRNATKARREKEQLQKQEKILHPLDTNSLMRLACQVPMKSDKRRVFYDAEMATQAAINPDPFAATTTHDPFLSATMYLDERATDKYEKQFKNWLNALVTVPVDMDSDQGSHVLDVGKIFNEVRHNKKETVAQTKESVSCKYFTKYRMPLLRRAAVELYTSNKIVLPLSKLDVLIEKKQIEMRADRNLHLDLVLQRNILELLLCFNTLWLRIGLEVVFGEEIPLTSNADIYGLTGFVLNRMFRDKYLEGKYSKNFALTAKYAEQIKKHALRKLLHLIVFLDAAKEERIIKHNPCLFTRASPFKETKEVLIKVASNLIANIGDITKYMKRLGIMLVHKQTYLDEFDYAFTNLAVDLRDGIRLVKVMEIIVLRDDLTRQLRYPAVSRLQKIHNVDVGLKALQEADYQIHGEITAKDIVDGHREKTLSLLWQLIYRFRAPKFNAAATVVQRWWRVRLLHRELSTRIRERKERRMREAAVVIQRYFRGYRTRRWVPEYLRERTIASVVVQTYFRAFAARKKFQMIIRATREIQCWWRRNKDMHTQRKRFLEMRSAALVFQMRWRAKCQMEKDSKYYEDLRRVTIALQRRWRANVERRKQMRRWQEVKSATMKVQTWWRAVTAMREERQRYTQIRQATLTIQRRFRDYKLMKIVKMDFVRVQYSTMVIQRFFRGYKQMKLARMEFTEVRRVTVTLQRRFRARKEMRKVREEYLVIKRSVLTIEAHYKARLLAKEPRKNFLRIKWAAETLQRQFRAQLAMKSARDEFQDTREKIIKIQRYFRGFLEMKKQVARFLEIKSAVLVIQRQFRALQMMIAGREAYQRTRAAIISIQRWVRANKARDQTRELYLNDRRRIIQLQQRWRAIIEGRKVQKNFVELREAAIVFQTRFRATQAMKVQRESFQEQKRAVIVLQRAWRARQIGIRVREEYAEKKALIVGVQRRWRATLEMRKQRREYLALKQATVCLQSYWRARTAMRVAVAEYQQLRRYTVIVQCRWKATLEAREHRVKYLLFRQSVIDFQSHIRGFLVRQDIWRKTKAAMTLQMYFRLHLERKRCREQYLKLRETTLAVQRHWRRVREMRRVRAEFLYAREMIIRVQRQFRAQQAMRREREQFLEIKRAVITLQQQFKAVLEGKKVREEMEQQRQMVVRIQSLCRGHLARAAYKKLWYEKMSPEAIELRKRNAAALKIQSVWRAYRVRRRPQSKALKTVREKIEQSRKVKTQDRITVRQFLGASMYRLKLGLNVSDATKIFRSLDFYSRVVPHVLVANCVQVARYCYTMLSQATRSEPHKYLIELCCRVALNLARYEETKKQIFLYEYLETIGQMLLRWSDKECPIFNTLCTLIYVFIQTPHHKKIIHNYMTAHDGVFILKETKKAVDRKEKMLTNKQRLGVFRTQSTETQDMTRLPTLECDYGIEMATHLYVFKSRVFALDTVLSGLEIDLH